MCPVCGIFNLRVSVCLFVCLFVVVVVDVDEVVVALVFFRG